MSDVGAPYVTVSAPPRGGGEQAEKKFFAQRVRGSFAWGGSPATATLTYVGNAPVTTGAAVNFKVGAHYFAGICRSDSLVHGSGGDLRVLEFQDLRYFLTNDWFFGAFNVRDVKLTGGTRLKRYKHMYPADWSRRQWTYTTRPLTTWQILDAVLRAPTVFTHWHCDLTSNGMFPGGLLNGSIYEIDALSGMRLDAFLNLLCDKTGLVFCHDPVPGQVASPFASGGALRVGPGVLGDYRLVFTRKGLGVLPLPYPKNADERRLGYALSENATNVCVLGDSNLYQMLEVPMVKDWAEAWEAFLDVDVLAKDLYDHEINPLNGVRYNAYAADPERWLGAGDAKARALEITVAEYVRLRNARSPGTGNVFSDNRKYAGRFRMDLPAALYIERLVFHAFRPHLGHTDTVADSPTFGQFLYGLYNKEGEFVPLDSAPIADQMLARTYYDAVDGTMTTDDPPSPADGNGLLIAKGYQAGEDLFRLVQPDRINENFFQGANRLWTQVNFQADDSGEGVRFILTDCPVFVSDNLLTTVDGKVVLNAGYTLGTPSLKAALVFECERFVYWRGQGLLSQRGRIDPSQPRPGRNRVEQVGGLAMEFIVDADGDFTEIAFADGKYADDKALPIALDLLLCQPVYYLGGYNLKWNPKLPLDQFGTHLAPAYSSMLDRIEIETGPDGVMEVVDFTSERQKQHFEPERELERRTLQNSLFPGQTELRQSAADQKRFNQTLRTTPERQFRAFRNLLRGEVDENLHPTKFIPGASVPATLPAGSVIVRSPSAGVATAPAAVDAATDKVFVGVVVRQNEPTAGNFHVKAEGEALALVQGPVGANDAIGLSAAGGTDFADNGAYLTKGGTSSVGVALEAIADTSIKLIKVRLGSGGGTAQVNWNYRGTWDPAATDPYMEGDVVSMGVGTASGMYYSTIDGNDNAPDSGIGWVQVATGTGTFL